MTIGHGEDGALASTHSIIIAGEVGIALGTTHTAIGEVLGVMVGTTVIGLTVGGTLTTMVVGHLLSTTIIHVRIVIQDQRTAFLTALQQDAILEMGSSIAHQTNGDEV